MMRSVVYVIASLTLLCSQEGRKITFPDVGKLKTVLVDLHMHTVFSDGSVWPNIRVEEAYRDGIDLIAMTEHLEYQPHKQDIPHPDRNRAYEIAKRATGDRGLIVINGSEITRSMPPGHTNAVFINDANKLLIEPEAGWGKDKTDAQKKSETISAARKQFEAANQQKAFVFWNHPNWTAQRRDGIAKTEDLHLEFIKKGWLHGIEVVNDLTYSSEALAIALKHNLTIIGTSDIHGLVDWQYHVPHGGHRPVTLVFSKSKSVEDIKAALFAGKTAVYNYNTLIGKAEHVNPLIDACLSVVKATYGRSDSKVLTVDISNVSDVEFMMYNLSDYTFHGNAQLLRIKPNATTRFQVKSRTRQSEVNVKFRVVNAIIAPKRHPEYTLKIKPSDL